MLSLTGCGAPAAPSNRAGDARPRSANPGPTADSYRLKVAMDPSLHRLEAEAALRIRLDSTGRSSPTRGLRLQLHPDLLIDVVTCQGRPVPSRRIVPATQPASQPTSSTAEDADDEASGFTPTVYELTLPRGSGPTVEINVKYGGILFQDVTAGEKPGEIHNFEMRAHVGEEGIYLASDACWYPRIAEPSDDKDRPREITLSDFELTAAHVPNMVLVACGNRAGARLGAARPPETTWATPFPIDGMTLVGGPHEVFERQVGRVLVSVHLSAKHARFAAGLLDAVESYLKLYEPLLGPYPYAEFTVVENFFSSGFAFPGYTVLASAVIGMGEMGLRPGYLDHEMLHNWWGNGVFVSALDGNWCECLTSYCANYMRPVLQHQAEKARAQRRDICYGLSLVTPKKDKPLGRFGRKKGPSRFIGYQKGSMVFAMLARKIGPDRLWTALRRLRTERLGRATGWDDIRRAVEAESGRSLEQFFNAWVRGKGVPDIRVDSAVYDPQAMRLVITTMQQGDRLFDVDLPVRIVFKNGARDETIPVSRAVQVSLIRSLAPPKYIEIDPDFEVMRRIPPDYIMPTISSIGKPEPLVIVRAKDDFAAYDAVADAIRKRYKHADDRLIRRVDAEAVTDADLKKGHTLILGKACLAAPVARILDGSDLSFQNGAFTVGGERYDKPGQAVLCAIRNKEAPPGVICFYYGNSKAALKKATYATFYGGNSLVVFNNSVPIRREDFERPQRVDVEIGS